MWDIFLAGAPFSRRDVARILKAQTEAQIALLRARGDASSTDSVKRVALHAVLEIKEHTIDRITDKSIGLLQFLALLLAIALFGGSISDRERVTLSVLIILASIPLLLNMFLIFRRDPARHRDIRKDINDAMVLIAWRGLTGC
jgi:hypothetical protein